MKIGDIFIDGGRKLEVIGQNDAGFIAKVIEVGAKPEVKPEKVVDEDPTTDEFGKTYTKTEVNRMPKEKLEILAQSLGLEVGTTADMKKDIIAKLGL